MPDPPGVGSLDQSPSDPALDYVGLVEQSPDAILLVLRTGSVGWLNTAARRLFAAPEQAVGRSLLEVVRDHRLDTLVRRVLEGETPGDLEILMPVSGRTLRAQASRLASSTGAALRIQDLTRVRHLETVRQQFVANLSHELRTPLAGLDLAAQTLSGQLPPQGPTRTFMDRILQESERLAAILQNLAQLSALDAEQIQVDHQSFSVRELVLGSVARYAARASAAGLGLRSQIDAADELLAVGDRAKTEQAIQSLVDNALKFTPTGEVVLSATRRDQAIEIAVSDTGIGIPPQDLPRIFERFYKVDRARGGQVPGTGLGLSIARHLVELQGGSLRAESTPGTGTTMRLSLPQAGGPRP